MNNYDKCVRRLQARARAGVTFTWYAKTIAGYGRAIELDLIGGWDSWEQYEHYMLSAIKASKTPIGVIPASPDEIVSALKEYNLPNTPEGRSQIYFRLGIAALQIKEGDDWHFVI